MSKTKLAVAINDLSGLGQSSLCAAIPILSVMGVQVCPLPTAVLSSQTDGYSGYSFTDMTAVWPAYIAHWQKEAPQFDCIYSGFLGSAEQIAIITDFLRDFATDSTLIVVDPVLGDGGKLYDTMNDAMVLAMGELIRHAHVITPNYTELCLLSAISYTEQPQLDLLAQSMARLSLQGPEIVVVTGIPGDNPATTYTAIYDRKQAQCEYITTPMLPAHYPGSGDIFASVMTGALLQGATCHAAAQLAVDFVYAAIKTSLARQRPFREGVDLQQVLPRLLDPATRKDD